MARHRRTSTFHFYKTGISASVFWFVGIFLTGRIPRDVVLHENSVPDSVCTNRARAFVGMASKVLLCGLVIRVGAFGVVCYISDICDFGDGFFDHDFHALFEGDIDHPTALASAAKLEKGRVFFYIDQ